ncbi:hypothetical protein Nepgr_019939 [Nepenthes gracilis]|uniref:Protein EARLY FLOWERING 4 domain-containing protein n=1 Tax=Nepenthes gracilis TaxID=150966 RepID=A0AAD3SV15_NEPGR|nr:hypothetical protein Nepgr_019939 [Nepenthes gracilis]
MLAILCVHPWLRVEFSITQIQPVSQFVENQFRIFLTLPRESLVSLSLSFNLLYSPSDNVPDLRADGFDLIRNSKVLQTFQLSFVQVQNILDQNRLLINEINQNHESRIPDNLSRNVGLIRELNNNIRRVVDLYADVSHSFTKHMGASSEGDSSGAVRSDGKAGHKRNRAA